MQAILALGACLCLCCCMFCVYKKDESNRRNTAGTRLDKMEERTAIDDDGGDEVSCVCFWIDTRRQRGEDRRVQQQ